jgi:hypothetical protein
VLTPGVTARGILNLTSIAVSGENEGTLHASPAA